MEQKHMGLQQCEGENPIEPSSAEIHTDEHTEEEKKEDIDRGLIILPDGAKNQHTEEIPRVEIYPHEVNLPASSLEMEDGSVPSPPEKKANKKRTSKLIFVSYSSDSSFLERKFVSETVRQLKENNLAGDIWFDADEVILFSPMWVFHRLEVVEKCRAAIIFLSESYFSCPMSVLESKILFERSNSAEKPPKVFPILFTSVEIPKTLSTLFRGAIDLTGAKLMKTSLSEKCSLVIGNLSSEIDKYSIIRTPFQFNPPCPTETKGEFRRKSLVTWRVEDVQEWLAHLGIREFYQQMFAENTVDGYLLLSLNDESLLQCLV
ncbi:uncharacterized protein [Pleurodeles waltl]|uniref:uncharacterized protein n=1 Tax=Pleurodeles waltl TaxID=8319 RepID=UPI0037094693